MNKRFMVFVSLVLTLSLLCSLCPAALAEEDDSIRIRTVQDLTALAENCSLDTWSDGKKIVLDADLSLSGVNFQPIPIFNGEFDGNGHEILDLSLDAPQSPCGLFLETGKDANIHDLTVSGTVAPRGNDSMVGGVVGLNRGVITNCSFTGSVSANDRVGGIAGRNEGSGVVTACTASGSVRGLNATGGIVGENAGAIVACDNRSFVNTESVDPSLRLDTVDTSSILNFLRSLRSDSAGITSDTGGVAGSSTGFVERCSNSGTVGYLHLGYNVGGVVGRSGGYVNGCRNDGEVYGRKDVGGIVGQAEPFTEIKEAENLLSGLAYRFAALSASIDTAIADARGVSDDLAMQFATLPAYLSPVASAIAQIDLTDPESAWSLQGVIADCVAGVSAQLESIGHSVGGDSDAILADVQDINDNLNALSGTAVQAMGMLSGASESGDILVDASDDTEGEGITLGKTAESINYGSVYGDSNVGGVAGSISLENDLDPESELTSNPNSLVKNQISMSAVIFRCSSSGEITAKHECVGGIAGRMDLGLASGCSAYGAVAVEDGGYAGGICGLCYGQVSNSCSKLRLNAEKYVGGIVGNGFNARDGEEKSSLVSGCYALVEIEGAPQFAGAVSGGGDGVYTNNFFVPAGFAALDKLSIHGQAEPISFEEFAAVESLPDACKSFTLRFVVDGVTVKEVPFQYGDSFDRSVFPKVERRNGAYAVWNRSDLSDLRFDTTVTAEYRMDETVLRSADERSDGRAAVYVDGQFQQGDSLRLEQIPVGEDDIQMFSAGVRDTVRSQLRSIFREGEPDYSIPVSVVERLRVSFPDDGLNVHTLRYLAPDGQTDNYHVYLASDGGWQRLHPGTFGSYFLFDVPGSGAELALVATIQSWWVAAYIASALVLLALIVLLAVKLKKTLRARPKREKKPLAERPAQRFVRAHKKGVALGAAAVLVTALAITGILRFGSIGPAISTYRILKDFARQETDVQTGILVHVNERDVEMSTTVHRVREDGKMIRCIEQYGIPLYVSDGMIYLENGRGFRVAGGSLDQGAVLDIALDVFLHEDVRRTKDGDSVSYEAVIDGETANRILQHFLPESYTERLNAESMTISIRAEAGALTSLSFTGEGVTESSTPFTISVDLTTQPLAERPVIPQSVLDAIGSGAGAEAEILSEDLLRLLAAWIKYESAESVSADITVSADCGPLSLSPRYEFSRVTAEGTDICCVKSRLFTVYFTDSAACTENGSDLSEAQARLRDAAKLIPAARELCLRGRFRCAANGGTTVYTITLDPDGAGEVAKQLVPELRELDVDFSESVLKVTVEGGALKQIEFDGGGSLRVVSRDVDASVRVTARFADRQPGVIPAGARAVLLK